MEWLKLGWISSVVALAACVAAEPGEPVGPDVVERELVGKNLARHPAGRTAGDKGCS